jgi:RHS repeat-associated protein
MRVATTGADDMTCSLPPASLSTRGFTNQEQMTDVCLDNYNARIYDPQIGRFMSADTEVPDAYHSQSYNRYTYVENGPLSYTDPTGHGTYPTSPLTPGTNMADAAFAYYGAEDVENSGGNFLGKDAAALMSNSTQGGATSGQGSAQGGVTINLGQGNSVNFNTNSQRNADNSIPGYALVDESTETGKQIAAHGAGASAEFNADTGVLSLTGGAGPQSGSAQTSNSAPVKIQALSAITVSGAQDQKSWRVIWHLYAASTDGGYVIQRVDVLRTFTNPDGSSHPAPESPLWEAWRVSPGHDRPNSTNNEGYDDDLGVKNIGPDVTTTITTSARFYEGLDELPSSFQRGLGKGHSGVLWYSTVDPNLPLDNATAPVERTSTYVNPR